MKITGTATFTFESASHRRCFLSGSPEKSFFIIVTIRRLGLGRQHRTVPISMTLGKRYYRQLEGRRNTTTEEGGI